LAGAGVADGVGCDSAVEGFFGGWVACGLTSPAFCGGFSSGFCSKGHPALSTTTAITVHSLILAIRFS
jgi:hypothetical protein